MPDAMVEDPREAKLPKWAQDKLADLRCEVKAREGLKQLHAFLSGPDRTWFTLPGPRMPKDQNWRKLWLLDSDQPFPVCTLFEGDVLFVGRAKRD